LKIIEQTEYLTENIMVQKKNFLNNKSKSIIAILAIFIVTSFVYFSPLLEGKRILGSDVAQYKGMAEEINDYREDTGEEALWTNSMFGGMPAYLISVKYPGNILAKIQNVYYKIPRPASYLMLYFGLFFLLLLLLKINPWIAFAGALAYGFNLAFFVWIDTGHMAKANAITYIAMIVAGILLAYRRKPLAGSAIAGVGLAFMLKAGHPQMTYYAGIMVVIIGITYLIDAIRNKAVPAFLKTSALLILAAVLALGANFSRLYTVYEYGKYSMRGESELTPDDEQTSGLDKSYILDYSYDLGEALTAFIPRFKGGGMAEPLGEDSKFYQEIKKVANARQAKQMAQNAPLYWGSQPISGAPFYYGAVLCFLFVLGLFLVKGKEKWWILATVVVALLLSLGKYLPSLAHFMVDYFPAYNKFRDVKNIIVIQQFAMALLGVLAVRQVYLRKITDQKFFKGLKWSFGIAGGIALLFAVIPGLAGDFVGASDARYAQMGWPQSLIDALQSDRKAVLRADAFRTFIFAALAAAGLWAFWKKKLKAQYALVLWVVLIFADMWPMNKKYLNNDDFVSQRKLEQPFTASAADKEILKDNSLDYRVLNLTVSPFNDASTSYFHKSIGGYHGAKLQRYQELIEHHISPEIQRISQRFQAVESQADIEQVFAGLNVINMLNTKYLIVDKKSAPVQNPQAMGNAWFVKSLETVDNADEEIEKLDEINIKNTAIVDKRFFDLLPKKLYPFDSSSSINLVSYAPNKLVYRSETKVDQVAVFSEIYYPKGWVAKIDGEEQPHFRVNYVLRAMQIPAGKHEIVFEFKPRSYYLGNKISFASSIILLLAVAGVVFIEIRKKRKTQNNEA
jgi:hypothetical protein